MRPTNGRVAAPLLVLVLLVLVTLAVPSVAAGPVGMADAVCDAAVAPLGAECLLDCDHIAHPTLRTACFRVDGLPPSVWDTCKVVLGPSRACDPSIFYCASTDPVQDFVCRDVVNPTLGGL